MSYPIPSVDPTDPKYPADDFVTGNNGDEVREPEDAPEPDHDRTERLYQAIVAINHMSRDDLTVMLNEINITALHSISEILAEAQSD